MSSVTTSPLIDTQSVRARLIAASPLAEHRVHLAGVDTTTMEGGDGPPIVLLHGQGEHWAVWLPVLPGLVRTHRVVVADLPGHGGSSPGPGRLDADAVVRWVDELVGSRCDGPPVLVGHLLGGAIAARYAVEHADRLAHLVLVDTLGLGWYRPRLRFAIPLVRFLARPTPDSRDRLFDECFVDIDLVGERFGDVWDDARDYALAGARRPESRRALRQLVRRVGVRPIADEALASITVPTSLIHGRDDLQVPLSVATRASRRHGWPLHVVDGARDDPAAEQPEAFLRALDGALSSRRGGGAS